MEHVSAQYLAIETIIFNVGIILVNCCFEKHGDKIYPHYPKILLLESVVYVIIVILAATEMMSIATYFIVDICTRAVITRNIMCCANKLKSIVYKGEAREKYDNTVPVASAIACCTGASIALFPIPLWLGWVCVCIGVSVDNVFYYLAYRESK